MIRGAVYACTLFLMAACGTSQSDYIAPDDGAAVFVTSGGSIFGGSSVYVYTDDVAVFSTNDGTPESVVHTIEPLRPGAFDRIREGALRVVGRTESVTGPQCQDYGFDVIGVTGLAGEPLTVSAACPDTAIVAAQGEVYALIDAERLP